MAIAHSLVPCFFHSSRTSGGMNPLSSIRLPLGVTIYYLANEINGNGEHARLLKNKNIKVNQIYYFHKSEHNLIIHRIPANTT